LVFFASALAAYVSGILAALTGMPRPADPHEKDIDAAWYAPSHADDARGADL
jgi:hypothetical protein